MATVASNLSLDQQMSGADPLLKLFALTRVRDIIDVSRKLVKTKYEESVEDLLKKLQEAKVTSAIVMDPQIGGSGVLGFVDVVDVLTHVLEVASQSKDVKSENMMNLRWEGKIFGWQNVGSIANISRLNSLETISSNDSILEVAQRMGQGVHRMAVIDDNSLVSIISQSDIIKFIITKTLHIGNKILKKMNQSGLSALGVAAVRWDVSVVDGIRYMRDYKASGVPVVNLEGKIICNFSATDLLSLSESNFHYVNLPIYDFLVKFQGTPKAPVTAFAGDTVESVMLKFAVHQIHRIYIVDEMDRPIGIISMTDILSWLMTPTESM